jgi:hypothetical protein
MTNGWFLLHAPRPSVDAPIEITFREPGAEAYVFTFG